MSDSEHRKPLFGNEVSLGQLAALEQRLRLEAEIRRLGREARREQRAGCAESECSYEAYCRGFAEWVQREYPESWARWIAGLPSNHP